jgi:Flp pilus assembly protein TadD
MTEARYRLASVLATMSQLNEAVQHLRVVLASNPQHLKALNDLAALYILQRKPDEAVTLLRKAQELAPDSAQVQQNLAIALQAQSDLAREAESAPVDSQ